MSMLGERILSLQEIQDINLQIVPFSEDIQQGPIDFSGNTTNFSSTLNQLNNHYSNMNIAAYVLISDGTTNIHPVWDLKGERFIYLSNKDNDYFGQTDLFIYDFENLEPIFVKISWVMVPALSARSLIVCCFPNSVNLSGFILKWVMSTVIRSIEILPRMGQGCLP